jgi:hypothetical protein
MNCFQYASKFAQTGDKLLTLRPKNVRFLGELPGLGANRWVAHQVIVRGGKVIDRAHPAGLAVSEWMAQFMAKNSISLFEELKQLVSFTVTVVH